MDNEVKIIAELEERNVIITPGETFLKGDKGEKGDKGDKGDKGNKGDQGERGIQGNQGIEGKSAYQVWLELGNTGTEQDFINSLKGEKGDKGDKGEQGTVKPIKGTVQDASFTQIYTDSPVIEGLEIKGKELTQKIQQGHNILYLDNINKSGTLNGIEYKFIGNEFTLNGTATQNTDIYAFGSWTSTAVNEKRNLIAGDYTLAVIGNENNNRFAVNMYNNGSLVISAYNTNISTKTLTENKGIANLYLSIHNGMSFTNETFKIMLLKGKYTIENLPEYEPYGIMPSIDYPSEINAKKNKFTTTFSQNGATRIKSGILNVEANTQYTFSATSTLGHPLQFAVNYYNAESSLISSSAYYNNGSSFTTPANTKTINIQVRDFADSGVSNPINVEEVIEPQLELGATKTAYQNPNFGLNIKITGKNFIGYKENGTATSQGITVDYNNGIFTVNGTVTQERDLYFNLVDILSINSYANQSKQPKRKLYKNKYMLSYKFISGTKSRADMNMVIANKVTNADIRFPFNNCHYTNKNMIVDITENLDYYIYFWLPKNMTFSNFKFTLQLEVGENITELEPYRNKTFNITLPENSFFGEFKGYKNYIKNNKLHNNLKLLILTGQENWVFSSPGYNLAKAGISNINAPYNSTNIMCNYFKVNTGTTAVGEMRVGTNYLVFNYDDGVGGVDAWKSFLQEKYNAGTPVIVLYVTNTEEEEELPEATQTLLNSIELYEDINNIGVEGGTVSFKYNKSLAREFEKIYSLIGATSTTESEVLSNADN